MSKARQFIKDCTSNCYNYNSYAQDPIPWLTPDQALAAVEIEREELLDKACEWLRSYRQDAPDGIGYISGVVNDKTIEEFKQAMEE